MPWKNEKDPYKIWLSEIILQQTRVEQGLKYYESFVENFPTVTDLAIADEDTVLRLWQGLGYYSRARNLHAAAKYIMQEFDGKFPETYTDILKLKGVGSYTAAAIASFAYNLPHAVVDGNVYRVLARYFGIDTPIDSTKGKKQFEQLATELLPSKQAGIYNQAIMDFGALVCKPQQPECDTCPLKNNCTSYQQSSVDHLPVKQGKISIKERFFHYLVIRNENEVLIQKRTGQDIWKNLYQFPMIEAPEVLSVEELQQLPAFTETIDKFSVLKTTKQGSFTQKLTHRKIHGIFIELWVEDDLNTMESKDWKAAQWQNLDSFAFPKIVNCYLADNTLYLNIS